MYWISVKKEMCKTRNILLLCIYILSFSLLSNGCKHKNEGIGVNKHIKSYYLIVGRQLEKEVGYLRAGKQPFDDRITVFINDNPIYSTKYPTRIFTINPFIRPGENCVKICLNSPQPFEAVITESPDNNSQIVKAHIQYSPNDKSLEYKFTFSANIDYELPIFKKENHLPEDKSEIDRNVSDKLKSLLDTLNKKNIHQAGPILLEGVEIYAPNALGISSQEIDKLINSFGEKGGYNESASLHFQSFEQNKYIIKYGPSLILVYRNDFQHVFFKSESDFSNWIPTTMAYINGKYIFWDPGI
jgi:hypothetical protein